MRSYSALLMSRFHELLIFIIVIVVRMDCSAAIGFFYGAVQLKSDSTFIFFGKDRVAECVYSSCQCDSI